MSDRLIALNFSAQAQVAATGAHRVKVPVGMTLVGMTVGLEALTGSPTNVKFTLKQGAVTLVDQLTLTAAGVGEWLSSHLGGANAPGAIPTAATVTVDVAFTGGSSPGADYDITLWLLSGTA